MTQDEEEQSAVDQLQEMIDGLQEDDNFLFIVQSEAVDDAAMYKAFSTGDYNTTINSAVVALTLAGKDIIANSSEEQGDPNDPGMDARAFFLGLQALSRTANQWASDIKASNEQEEGPKHVKETVEDSAGSRDAHTPRTANDGSSIH